ncbi:glucose-6-phosphate dehydrogenase assembly protein OpcA [Lysinibacter cavernae]|uniref:Glucose-6-phosphate dehydrogenase assembly protein OpcA n=1 Tax=Lysinibacter cavernae TaxID=1640652 RepID=A0A7X5QZE0_9MICO|nr:glucose-6-phosphate dehydrogenase assembly protein OpcA [Lysinibacter cavernae]NIH52829.1 glucose-6-phosphate dehydrogenase assembly protein OpcA [Lysinibacter cavernae]
MIVELPDTTVSNISKALVRVREDGGAVALGRVLTLVISTDPEHLEDAVQAANDASREHPMRVVVVAVDQGAEHIVEARIDAQIRVGGDAGASEVIILHAYGAAASDSESLVTGLLLPDTPVVVWWAGVWPGHASQTSLGKIAQRRITDATTHPNPQQALVELGQNYSPGDTDLSWSRITLWRAQLATVLDQPPFEAVEAVEVNGSVESPSTTLLAAWLFQQLDAPVTHHLHPDKSGGWGVDSVQLKRASGTIELERTHDTVAQLSAPGQPVHDLSLPRRSLRDCLAEELRHLDPDELYGRVITNGVAALTHENATA